jgi:thiamine-phosphate pyrophosphorylase
VQLRVKDKPEAQLRKQIQSARTLCESYDCQLVVNDYWQLAIECGCDFIHLGQEDLDGADIAAIRQAGIKIGISTHDKKELKRALAMGPDYIALGPIYPTVLKQMKWRPQGLDKIADWRSAVAPIPLVAIGGLTCERAPAVWQAGADCICVVTDVLRHSEPADRLRQWLQLAVL